MSGLARYVLAATVARIATGASPVTIVLIARAVSEKGSLAGVLAACLTAPHILGPIYGRWLDNARDTRLIIAAACFIYPLLFKLSLWSLSQGYILLAIFTLAGCGACSAFMMGGLSTQLVKFVPSDLALRRRAQSWDTLTYGIGLTAGPLSIALLTAHYSAPLSASLLMSLPLLAGAMVLTLPSSKSNTFTPSEPKPSFREVARTFRTSAALKRTVAITASGAFSIAALPVLAVFLSEVWQGNQQHGAYLVTLYGVGTLCGALLLMLRPMQADALTLLRNIGIALLITLLFITLSPNFAIGLITYWLCGVVNSIFFAATLAARTEYAPERIAAQIYLWVAAAKISAGSIGAVVAGSLVDISIRLPLIIAVLSFGLVILLCFWRRP